MTADACDREDLRIALGALALDALDPAEAREVRRHLADCADCQAEYSSFLGVRTMLDAGLVGGAARAERQPAHVLDRRPRGRGSRLPSRRRIGVAVGGVAASVAVAVAAFLAGAAGQGPATATAPTPFPTSTAPISPTTTPTVLPTVTNAEGVSAALAFREVPWGTTVQITMSNVPDNYTCKLTAYTKSNTEVPVASWTSVHGRAMLVVPGAVALKPSEIDHFEVELNTKGYDILIPMSS